MTVIMTRPRFKFSTTMALAAAFIASLGLLVLFLGFAWDVGVWWRSAVTAAFVLAWMAVGAKLWMLARDQPTFCNAVSIAKIWFFALMVTAFFTSVVWLFYAPDDDARNVIVVLLALGCYYAVGKVAVYRTMRKLLRRRASRLH